MPLIIITWIWRYNILINSFNCFTDPSTFCSLVCAIKSLTIWRMIMKSETKFCQRYLATTVAVQRRVNSYKNEWTRVLNKYQNNAELKGWNYIRYVSVHPKHDLREYQSLFLDFPNAVLGRCVVIKVLFKILPGFLSKRDTSLQQNFGKFLSILILQRPSIQLLYKNSCC